MNYAHFLRLRAPYWDRFERALAAARGGIPSHEELEALAMGYRQLLHDHALAAARFPATGAARRLRRLASEGTRYLHRERSAGGGLVAFFLSTFPAAMRRRRAALGVALAVFALLALFGLGLSILRPAMGVYFVGAEAVEGLRAGRLWTESLTTTVPPSTSSSMIATNNLSVALTAWAGGALAGLGSLFVLMLNGLMLGSVIGLTMHYSMSPALFEFIAAHGPLELTLIVVCAGGGLVLGRALVAAEDRPRGEVLREDARDALAIVGGCLPWLVVLALIEVLVSPSPAIEVELKAALGIALEVAFLALALRRPASAHGDGDG